MTIDELIALVNVQTTPTPDGQTLVDVQAPPEVWVMLEPVYNSMAKREGTTAHEIMGDLVSPPSTEAAIPTPGNPSG